MTGKNSSLMESTFTPLSLAMLQLYLLSMLFFTASSILTIIFPLQAEKSGFSEGEIGFIMGITMFVCMILRPWAGQMIAKYSVKKMMKWLLIGHAVTLTLYILFGIHSLYVVRVLQGIVLAFFSMSMQLGISDLLRNKDRGQGMSMYTLSTVMPSLYGPILAINLWQQLDAKYLFGCIVVLAILPLLLFFRAPLPNQQKTVLAFSFRELLGAVKKTTSSKGLVIAAITMILGSTIIGAISTFLPLYMLKFNLGNLAVYLFIQALVVVGSRFILRKRIPSDGHWHPSFIILVLLSSSIGTTMLAFGEHLGYFIYLSAMFNGLASAMLYPTIVTYISFAIPEKKKHILLGVYLATYDLGFSFGSLAMGVVVQYSSYAFMFIVCSIVAFIAIGLVLLKRNIC
ncbi:staphylopine family metallophore export MFS transporter CntE [Lysinibacillus sp. NPDC093197]|uniref:staphylopine family metallophore export MFS transporter CntE n=1 Tax=Lysinibacillus sp. NPDC093197 TaxID=3364132 RepID=UPI0037FEE6EC